jgi:hypothetical protein
VTSRDRLLQHCLTFTDYSVEPSASTLNSHTVGVGYGARPVRSWLMVDLASSIATELGACLTTAALHEFVSLMPPGFISMAPLKQQECFVDYVLLLDLNTAGAGGLPNNIKASRRNKSSSEALQWLPYDRNWKSADA